MDADSIEYWRWAGYNIIQSGLNVNEDLLKQTQS